MYEKAPNYRRALGIGDANGDGMGDLLVADGETTRLLSGNGVRELKALPDRWGYAISAAGDIDKDGHADWLIGNPLTGERPHFSGFVQLISGRTGGVLWEERGAPDQELGWSVAGLGDSNADGWLDLAVTSVNDVQSRTVVIIVSGKDFAHLHEVSSSASGFRHGVGAAGDLDGDGCADVVFNGEAGSVLVISGRTGAGLYDLRRPLDRWGEVFDGVGDIDADGRPDVAVGSWNQVVVFSGRTGESLREIHEACLGFGHGDFDGDGHFDLLVTRNVSSAERNGPIDQVWDQGRLEVLSGRDGAVLFSVVGADLHRMRGD
ncbi:MAG: VCBS repeat-containing protein [Planctomycetes bacterium]|nr:VCBS repeat-containing protein [Planctomycetota bacterium]